MREPGDNVEKALEFIKQYSPVYVVPTIHLYSDHFKLLASFYSKDTDNMLEVPLSFDKIKKLAQIVDVQVRDYDIETHSDVIKFIPPEKVMEILYLDSTPITFYWTLLIDEKYEKILKAYFSLYYEIISVGDEPKRFSLVELNEFPDTLKLDQKTLKLVQTLKDIMPFEDYILNAALIVARAMLIQNKK